MNQQEVNQEVQILFQKYQDCLIREPTSLVVLRTPVTNINQLEIKPSLVSLVVKDGIQILDVAGSEPIELSGSNGITSISWGTVSGEGLEAKYIKCEAHFGKPIIFYAQKDVLEIWYDRLARVRDHHKKPETDASKAFISLLESAVKYSSAANEKAPPVPEPPTDLDTVSF